MNTRPATPRDLDAVVSVKVEAVRPVYERTGSALLASDYDVDEQRAWLRHVLEIIDKDSPLLVALDDVGVVVGWIRLGRDVRGDGATAEINGLFVAPARQQTGVGRCLVSEGCRAMAKRGSLRVKVQTLASSPACALYERLGGCYDGDVPFRGQFNESVYRWDDIRVL